MFTTLNDVLEGLEPLDALTYRNRHGQVMRGEVVAVDLAARRVTMSRPDWRSLGFGPEVLEAGAYELLSTVWLDDDAVCTIRSAS